MSELDDLKTPSITEEEPLFSIKNFFKPTSKNVLSWATILKGFSVTGMASSFAVGNAYIFYAFMFLGGLAEAFIYFTKEKPTSTIKRAVEDEVKNPES